MFSFPERQLVYKIGVKDVRSVKISPGELEIRVVLILQGTFPVLTVVGGIGQSFRETVISLKVKSIAEAAADFDLQRVIEISAGIG